MATLTVRINMYGEAFEGRRKIEVTRILLSLVPKLAFHEGAEGRIMDMNGNTCGDYAVTED